ncbi:MAG: tetratricopeptide repeat protein [Planctomycetaceae bacterium]|nr:tetratricopeptide repeat protein [Planctomycetaceae bacterium]
MATIGEMLNQAIADHQAGRLPEAETVYRQILSQVPQHSDVWHLLGVLAYQVGKPKEAVELIERAIALVDGIGVYYANLAEALRSLQQNDRAEAMFRRALELDPNQVEARNNLALLLQQTNRAVESLPLLDAALTLRPDYPEARNNRGLSLEALGREAEAIDDYVTAARLRPTYAAPLENLARLALKRYNAGQLVGAGTLFELVAQFDPRSSAAWSNLGAIRFQQRQFAAAVDACQRAIDLNPAHAEAWNNLGSGQLKLQRHDDAERSFRRALEYQPNFPGAITNLALLLGRRRQFDEAEALYRRVLHLQPNDTGSMQGLGLINFNRGEFSQAREWYDRALAIEPNSAETLNKIGTCVMAQGMPSEAIHSFNRALEVDPQYVVAHSNQLFCHLYVPDITLAKLAELHRNYFNWHARPWVERQPRHTNRPEPDRRLRVGFVSADLRHHPIGYLLQDTFAHLDPAQLELACYATRSVRDELSEQLRAKTVLWRDVETLDDDELADVIRRDQIDILIDLAGHTSGGRLLAFARKPAPVQATWMGYPSTTGISAIDYLFSDRCMTPEGYDQHFAERIYRMPDVISSYRLPTELPPLAPPPSIQNGYVTFGSFNNTSKINPSVIALWSRVLNAVPRSRMFLKFRALNEPAVQERLLGWFAEQGIDRSRLDFEGHSRLPEMLAAYGRVDVALDTLPYTGGTTTILALLMGVPVVTLPGETMAGRQSLSVLTQAGCTQLVATDADDFVKKATTLVADSRRLAELRPVVRRQMQQAPFCDSPRIAGQFTTALRQMWRDWAVKQ